MYKQGYSEEQIIGLLKQADTGESIREVCRQYKISYSSFYKWHSKFKGMDISDAKKLHYLRQKNSKLKKLAADLMPDNTMFKTIA